MASNDFDMFMNVSDSGSAEMTEAAFNLAWVYIGLPVVTFVTLTAGLFIREPCCAREQGGYVDLGIPLGFGDTVTSDTALAHHWEEHHQSDQSDQSDPSDPSDPAVSV